MIGVLRTMNANDSEQLFDSNEVAKRLKISPVTVRKYSNDMEKLAKKPIYTRSIENRTKKLFVEKDISAFVYIMENKAKPSLNYEMSISQAYIKYYTETAIHSSNEIVGISLQNELLSEYQLLIKQQNEVIEKQSDQIGELTERLNKLIGLLEESKEAPSVIENPAAKPSLWSRLFKQS